MADLRTRILELAATYEGYAHANRIEAADWREWTTDHVEMIARAAAFDVAAADLRRLADEDAR